KAVRCGRNVQLRIPCEVARYSAICRDNTQRDTLQQIGRAVLRQKRDKLAVRRELRCRVRSRLSLQRRRLAVSDIDQVKVRPRVVLETRRRLEGIDYLLAVRRPRERRDVKAPRR